VRCLLNQIFSLIFRRATKAFGNSLFGHHETVLKAGGRFTKTRNYVRVSALSVPRGKRHKGVSSFGVQSANNEIGGTAEA
jgi:hypothetical protein